MKENQVKLEILETADVADMNELYKCIEEIGKVNVELMKLMANQKQDIRKILTEDQRIIFDLHEDHQKQGKQKRQSREGKSKGKSKGKRN
jgi:Spy/CpxP family protein refolding chaperone